MPKIRISKIEAARRQIDVAIRMLFAQEDAIAIHSLSMAAFRILRDLSASDDDNYMNQVTKGLIKEGREREFWSLLQKPANFLKHADRDPHSILDDFDEEANDAVLFLASVYYQSIGELLTPEMTTLIEWFLALHPDFLKDDADLSFRGLIYQASRTLTDMSRKEQLAKGQEILELIRTQPSKNE
jgi:hypothetical protein